MVKSRKEADLIISIDGCPVQCAEKTLRHPKIESAIQKIVNRPRIEKSHDIALDEDICSRVVDKAKRK